MAKKANPKPMSERHKAALAAGRAEGRAVREYLEALDGAKAAGGRRRTEESIRARLARVEKELGTADAVARLGLLQERRDLEAELSSVGTPAAIDEIEKAFVAVAAAYSERKGIEYATWREAGVSAAVLKQAGISRRS